jgi:hypothetical protein
MARSSSVLRAVAVLGLSACSSVAATTDPFGIKDGGNDREVDSAGSPSFPPGSSGADAARADAQGANADGTAPNPRDAGADLGAPAHPEAAPPPIVTGGAASG